MKKTMKEKMKNGKESNSEEEESLEQESQKSEEKKEKKLLDKKIPCFLIENKIDLVDEDTIKNIGELSEFSQKNNFSGFYRTSAKTGENVDFIMNSIIGYVINKLVECLNQGEKIEKRTSLFELKSDGNKDKNEKNVGDECC